MNWKLRLKNKETLTALLCFIVAFVYQVLGLFGIVPPVTEDQALNLVGIVITLLMGLGVVVDPTTDGVADSKRAMKYEEPWKDEL